MSKLSFPPPWIQADGKFVDAETATDPGNEIVVLTTTIAAGESWRIVAACLNNPMPGVIKVLLNSQLIGSGLIRSAETNLVIPWVPGRQVVGGDTIDVTFSQMANTPITTVRSHLMLADC